MTDSIDNINAIKFINNVDKHNITNDIDFLVTQISDKANLNILDVGYGTGRLLSKLRDINQDINLYGVEKSLTLFEHSKNELTKENIQIFCSDFEKWDTKIKFDTIIMSFYLHHINDFSVHINKALNILNGEGKLIICDRIAIDDNAKLEFLEYWTTYYANQHEWDEECPNIFTKQELQSVIEKANCRIELYEKVPNDNRNGTMNFPKTIAIIKK